jgi:hypothetical protein
MDFAPPELFALFYHILWKIKSEVSGTSGDFPRAARAGGQNVRDTFSGKQLSLRI